MAPTRYTNIPEEAPQPRLWKSLGQVLPGLIVNYAITGWGDELDVDREAELRAEINGILSNATRVDDGARLVRYAQGSWPELLIQLQVLSDEDWAGVNTPPKRRN